MKKLFILLFCCLWTFSTVFYGFAANFYQEALNCDSIYVVGKESNMAVVEKNVDKKRSPASLTKIMTYLIAKEIINDINNEKIIVKKDILDKVDPESSGSVLKEGEEFTPCELFHCMLICSSGYAAMVLADYAGNGIENFVVLMNEKAKYLGCENTNFVNPDGIYNQNQYTTARDMYLITREAMKDPLFLDIVNKTEYNMFGDARDPIITTNKMIDKKRGGEYYLPYVKGIKTGYVEEAGRCLVSYAEKDNSSYVIIAMGGPTKDENGNYIDKNMAMIDSKNIYLWAFQNLKSVKLYPANFPVKEIKLELAKNSDKLLLSPQSDFIINLPSNISKEDISLDCDVPNSVDAPIEAGKILGKAYVYYKGDQIGSFNLISTQTFKKNYFLVIVRWLDSIFSSPIFMFLVVILVVFMILYIRVCFVRYKNKKRRSKIKNFKKYKNKFKK
ncbi:MAG: D-alanyl-D-alanine carboxypeptidase family protein [Acutalibacteraceae bacterium]